MFSELLHMFFSMFSDGLNVFEIVILVGYVISVIVGIVKIADRYSRVQGWFTIIMGLCYSLLLFPAGNGMVTGGSVAVSVVVTVILNVWSWVAIYRFKVKDVFTWLQGYLLFIPIAFIAGILDELLSLPDLVVWQFVVLITSFLLEIFIIITKRDNVSRYSGWSSERDPLDDCTDEHNSVDITGMAD